ncbi:unnamed protein product, partial [Timema podura]|nr:unnamed protein product [Timema podura]
MEANQFIEKLSSPNIGCKDRKPELELTPLSTYSLVQTNQSNLCWKKELYLQDICMADIRQLRNMSSKLFHPRLSRMLTAEVGKIDISVFSEESRKHALKIKQKQVRRRFHECVYHWQPIIYNHHKGLLYLLGRSPAEFAVLFKIFCEMKQRLPNLAPRTIFDFGSGVGTTTW